MISTKQRAFLRSMANGLSPVVHIGKGGVTDAVCEQAESALEARELIKCAVLETAETSAREACELLCKQLRAEPVQSIGRKFVIYRRNHEKPRIELPR